jgi:hypothetical protein
MMSVGVQSDDQWIVFTFIHRSTQYKSRLVASEIYNEIFTIGSTDPMIQSSADCGRPDICNVPGTDLYRLLYVSFSCISNVFYVTTAS